MDQTNQHSSVDFTELAVHVSASLDGDALVADFLPFSLAPVFELILQALVRIDATT